MKEKIGILRVVNIILGLLSTAFFAFDVFVFIRLQPKMTAFKPLNPFELSLMTWVGVGLLILLFFYFFSTLQLAKYLRQSERIGFINILLLIFGLIAGVLVFSDVALLSDITKQYRAGLAQPEWSLVYPIMGYQFVTAVVFMYFHLTAKWIQKTKSKITRDVNIFLMVQTIGVICGLMGLALMSLGFFFHSGWNLLVHTIITSSILVFPYILGLGYWVITKLKEKDRQWFDEKQRQDVGKSAFLTLAVVSILMFGLFLYSFEHLDSAVRMLWYPSYIFSTLFIFSSGNLYFSSKG